MSEPRPENNEWEEFDEDSSPDGDNEAFSGLPYDEAEQREDESPILFAENLERTTRCSHCGTTWDRIRTDGRVGCASCYHVFREQLLSVMAKMQRGAVHTGKTPRAANKRRLRLEHLRKRRDNQLSVLKNRLQDAISSERYEEAAQLRDRIKVVSSSIFSEQ